MDVLNAELPGSTQVVEAPDVSKVNLEQAITGLGRTDAYAHWAVDKNQLPFLQGTCIAAPMSRTEDDDINAVRAAQAMGGHIVFDPQAKLLRVGVRNVPAGLAAKIQQQSSARPTIAVVTVSSGATVWIEDSDGNRLKKYGESDPNGSYATVTIGSIFGNGIGIRLWQQGLYSCTDPEVSGLCDGVL